ncbi:MAG: hypothetical protein WCL16_05130 [bacterium]
MLSGIAYVATAAAILRFIVHPLARTFTLAGMARLIETRHPEMQERLSSIVELLTSDDAPESRGSAELIEALKQEAIRDALIVRPGDEISIRTVLPFVIAAGSMLMILSLLFATLPHQTCFLLARAAAPFVNLPNVYATDLQIAPGDILVGEGSRIEILVKVANLRIGSATLRKSGADYREDSFFMQAATTPGQDRAFSIVFPAVNETFHYRIHAGDALSRYYTVRVVPPPAVAGVGMTFTHPDYSCIPQLTETNSTGDIRALAGTIVDVRALINKSVPFAVAVIQTPSATTNIPGRITCEKDGRFVCNFRIALTPGLTGLWTIQLKDEFGLTNTRFEHTIQAVPDAPPAVRILHLAKPEIHLNPIETLPVIYAAADDLGISLVELTLNADGQKSRIVLTNDCRKGGLGKLVDGETEINLPDLSLCRASRIAFQILASDTLPASFNGPQVGASQVFTIVIDANVPSLNEQVLNSEDQKLRQELQKVQQMLAVAQQNARAASESVERNRKLDPAAAGQLDAAQLSLAGADKTLRAVAEEMKGTYYDKVSRRIDDLAEDHVERAHALADDVKLAGNPESMVEKAGQAAAEVAAASDAVQEILKNLDELTPAAKRLLELVSLAARQKKLADLKLAMEQQEAAAQPQSKLPLPAVVDPLPKAEWQRAQEQVADELARIAKLTALATDDVRREVQKDALQATAQAEDLARQQQDLASEVARVADLQTADKLLQDLGREQAALAVNAKTNLLVSAHFEAMQKAAEAIYSDDTDAAIPAQMKIVEALTNRAEELRHPLPPEAQLVESRKVLDLQKKEQDLHQQVTDQVGQHSQALKALAARQTQLAAEARTNALTAPQADAMQRAADSIKAEQALQAARQQEDIEKALAAAAGQAVKTALTPRQQQEAQKVEDLANRQKDIAKKIGEVAAASDKAFHDIAREQESAAAETGKLPDTAAAVKAMDRAAGEIKPDQARKAVASLKNAARELQALADQAKAQKNATPQQQQTAQKLADLAATQKAMQKKIDDLAGQRAKAMQNLAAEEARLAAEAMQNVATAAQFEPMSKAAKAIMANQTDAAMPKLNETAKALEQIAGQIKNVQPTPEQLAQADQIRDLQARQASLRKQVNELNDQEHNAMAAIAAGQEKLAAEARENPRTAAQADPMRKIAEALKTDQPRQALPQQDAIEKNLAGIAEQLKQSPQPSAAQLQAAQNVAEVARKQGEILKKSEQLQNQKQKEVQNLAAEQAKLAVDAKADPATAPQSEAMQQAAEAMRAGNFDKAREAQANAAQALEKARAEIEHPEPAGEQKQAASAVEKLAAEQKAIHDRTATLIKKNREELNALAAEQAALAVEAKSVPAAAPQVPAIRQAAALLQKAPPTSAIPAQENVAKALKDSAARIEANPKATSAQKHDARRLNELAEKQEGIIEKTQKIAAAQARDLKELAAEQALLAGSAMALPLSAPQAVPMKQAADAIAQGKPADALKPQQAAAKDLDAKLAGLRSPKPTAQQTQSAHKAAELEQRQEQLAHKLDDYAARNRGIYAAEREEQLEQVRELQKQVAEQAAQIAGMTRDLAPQNDRLEAHAAMQAEQAADKLGQQQDLAEAARNATQSAADLDKLSDRLETVARQRMTEAETATRKNPESREAIKAGEQVQSIMDLAAKAAATAKLEQQAAREITALASGRPINGLMEQQKTLSGNAAALADTAARLKEQANDMEFNQQARQQVQQAADSANRAVQNANQAAKLIQDQVTAAQGKESPPPLPAPLQQQIQQAQMQAAQEFASAAKAMEMAAGALDQPMADSPADRPPNTNDEIPGAYEEARQAAQSQNSLDALQASEAIRQAIVKAAEYAQAAGINSTPEHRQTMSSSGGGQSDQKDASGEPPAWGAQVGMKLKNWLNLNGDLKDEVLQAQSEEGPEEYRGLIKRYFNEVSRRGGEEQ